MPPKRIDHAPKLVPSEQALLDKVLSEVKHCRSQGRPVLLLCETIKFSETLSDLLTTHSIPHELLNEIQESSEEAVLSKAGKSNAVTVATNTAGRGTDIRLDNESLQNGGLHVLLTFFPASLRVEEQARGRAGRQGQSGSSAIFFTSEHSLDEIYKNKKRQIEITKNYHIYLSKLSRKQFQFIQPFYSKLNEFRVNRQNIIERLLEVWNPRRLSNTKKVNYDNLNIKDFKIAKEATFLLNSNPQMDNTQKWRALLGKAFERVETLVIEYWARNFYHEIDSLFQNSELKNLLFLKEILNRIDLNISDELDTGIEKICDDLSDKMECILSTEGKLSQLIDYLDVDGGGVSKYLGNIVFGRDFFK